MTWLIFKLVQDLLRSSLIRIDILDTIIDYLFLLINFLRLKQNVKKVLFKYKYIF